MSFVTSILAWLHGVVTSFHNRLAAVEAKHGIETPPLDIHPAIADAVKPVFIPAGFDWSRYAGQPDNVAFMAFAMSGRGNPQDPDKASAYAAGVVKTIIPTPDQGGGAANDSLSWTSFDGHHPVRDFKPGEPVVCTVNFDAAAYSGAGSAPTGAFKIGLFETGGTVPCTMTAEVKDQEGNIVPCGPMGGGNGAMLVVPYQTGQTYTVAFTAPVATRWGIQPFPSAPA